MATLIVGLIVAAVLFLAARQLYKDKKSGKKYLFAIYKLCKSGSEAKSSEMAKSCFTAMGLFGQCR